VGKIGRLIALLATCFHTGFLLGVFFDPEDGGNIYSYEMLIDFQYSIQRYIPEDRNLHNHHCESLRSLRHVFQKGKKLARMTMQQILLQRARSGI
jgi:hypothetical protein